MTGKRALTGGNSDGVVPDDGQRDVALAVNRLVRRYSSDVAVGPLSFSIRHGEFFSLLGPSGCGKSTTLRCIAGFESVDSGEIVLGGRNIEQVPPHKRGIGLVFQSYTLFPHLSVFDNVAFGLKLQKVPRADIAVRVAKALELVALGEFVARMPSQLSGGQQQRVALARSLVMEPPLLLLDEPMSSLDLKLRTQMREELRALQRRLNMTTIFVTHDQTEALALSDRIAVLSQGKIEQIGTPEEIYLRPASRFVAQFIGNSNLVSGQAERAGDTLIEIVSESGLRLAAKAGTLRPGPLTALIRPERIRLTAGEAAPECRRNSFPAEIRSRTYLGEDAHFQLLVDGREPMLATRKMTDDFAPSPGQPLMAYVDPADVYILPA